AERAPAREASSTSSTRSLVENALDASADLIASNQLVAARATLSDALRTRGLGRDEQQRLRAALKDLNETIVFSPRIIPGDTMVEEYRVSAGDSLGKIARTRELGTHWKLIQRINGIARPERIRVGQRLKLVRGPFHAIVTKSEYRIDLYHGPPDEPERWTYITSRPVGLGLDDSTPVGRFVVREDSKLENPAWVNPRDPSDRYGRDDPDNPIGEYWVGLDGLGDDAVYVGYGLHGTVDPDSIGSQQSMGCVRMHDEDIALVYELLQEGASIVEIRP
ncbi:MAG: L,D-transpeptidase family protein, partial [Phycisphaerales bacterium JB059]